MSAEQCPHTTLTIIINKKNNINDIYYVPHIISRIILSYGAEEY